MAQDKHYKTGMKPKGGGNKIMSGTQQGPTAKRQIETHKVKNRTTNHNRSTNGRRG